MLEVRADEHAVAMATEGRNGVGRDAATSQNPYVVAVASAAVAGRDPDPNGDRDTTLGADPPPFDDTSFSADGGGSGGGSGGDGFAIGSSGA